MNKRKILTSITKSILSLVLVAGVSACCTLNTYATDGPVSVEIVELVDDGSGNYTIWQDIVSTMPGYTHSAIPRVRNSGDIDITAKLCLSESATDSTNTAIAVPANAFEIIINPAWSLDDANSSNPSDPAASNCYIHNSLLAPGELTEPLFTEVTLSNAIDNTHQHATFSLHLTAIGIGDIPEEPDTGFFSSLSNATPTIAAILIALTVATIIYSIFLRTRKRSH